MGNYVIIYLLEIQLMNTINHAYLYTSHISICVHIIGTSLSILYTCICALNNDLVFYFNKLNNIYYYIIYTQKSVQNIKIIFHEFDIVIMRFRQSAMEITP